MNETALTPMSSQTLVQVSSARDLVEAVPYLIGAEPTDSVVMLGVQPDPRGRVAPAIRLDLPPPKRFVEAAQRFVALLVEHGARAMSVIVHVDTPLPGRVRAVDFYRPLYTAVADACRVRGLTLFEAVCVERGRWWSYLCRDASCCPGDGTPVATERRSAIAAAAVTAGLPPPVPLSELAARLRTPEHIAGEAVRQAFSRARELLDRRTGDYSAESGIRNETIALLQAARTRFRRGDREMTCDEAARLVLGLRDVQARDQAMSWEDADSEALLALWIALARHSLPPDSAAPLTLVAWTAWTSEQSAFARVAINRALEADPCYAMAQLLHAAVNSPLDPAESRQQLFPHRVSARPRKDQ
ncbi:MAG: DUF4192 domain-containing protein [Streptomycetaceae bacterium]|nr:DUF4192 domain-containing protein [Streptomycetaceae bacterium]